MSEAAATATLAEDRGFLSTLADVFLSPGEAFRSIAARPRFVAPLALAVGPGHAPEVEGELVPVKSNDRD